MAIVRQTRREWGAIVERIRFAALGELDLPSKGVDVSPPLEDDLLLGREIDRHGRKNRCWCRWRSIETVRGGRIAGFDKKIKCGESTPRCDTAFCFGLVLGYLMASMYT